MKLSPEQIAERAERATKAVQRLESCDLCPRNCGVNRLEDEPGFDVGRITELDDGAAVVALVREVSRDPGQSKEDFLVGIRRDGSEQAKVLKTADRISNLIALGLVNDLHFVKRYVMETASTSTRSPRKRTRRWRAS